MDPRPCGPPCQPTGNSGADLHACRIPSGGCRCGPQDRRRCGKRPKQTDRLRQRIRNPVAEDRKPVESRRKQDALSSAAATNLCRLQLSPLSAVVPLSSAPLQLSSTEAGGTPITL